VWYGRIGAEAGFAVVRLMPVSIVRASWRHAPSSVQKARKLALLVFTTGVPRRSREGNRDSRMRAHAVLGRNGIAVLLGWYRHSVDDEPREVCVKRLI
jgi:hypothetical protein